MTTSTSSAISNNSAAYDAINKANGIGTAKETSSAMATQDRFLKLLTTQLKNQDPLNPLDNSQMTSQMAQISTVEGISKLNETLQKLITNSSDSQVLQAASLVNHGVLVQGSSMALTQNGAIAGVELASAADKVSVVIKDSNNLVVRKLELGAMPAGSQSFAWDGKSDSGEAAATGNYSFTVTAVQGGNDVTAKALNAIVVDSVERGSSGILLNSGSKSYALTDVREIL